MEISKPAYGEPCNGCGQCCMKYPCPVGQLLFGQRFGRCPALEECDDRFACGLVVNPHKYVPASALPVEFSALRDAAKIVIDAGNGCDAQFVGEPVTAAYRAAIAAEMALASGPPQPPSPWFLRALAIWGIGLGGRESA